MNNGKITIKRHFEANKRAVKLLREIYPQFLPLSAIRAFCEALQPLLAVLFSARLIDELAHERNVGKLALWAALAVAVTFVTQWLTAYITRKINTSGFEASTIRPNILRADKFAKMDYEHVENGRVTELLSGINGSENWSGLGLTRMLHTAPFIFKYAFGFVASLALAAGMVAVYPPLALLLLAPIVPVSVRVLFVRLNLANQAKLGKAMPKLNALYGYIGGMYVKPDNGAKDARIFGQKDLLVGTVKNPIMNKFRRVLVDSFAVSDAVTSGLDALIAAAAYVFVGLKALAGSFTIGQVTQYVGVTAQFASSVSGLARQASRLAENTPSLLSLYEYLDLPDVKNSGTLPTEKRGGEHEIEFKNVSFKYPNAADYALKNLNLKIHIDRKMAVVGMNGSGKTTMIKLLCRLYDPTEGEITLNGIDIKKYDYREYMDLFAAVFQDFKLTGFSLGENVAGAAVGTAEYDAEKAAEMLKIVGFGEKIALTTPLYKEFDAENGVTVSGGEAQKIAMARALYRGSPIIVLDEPTAALDPLAESEIYSKFDEIVGERTAIYISHRLSSCRFCDDIAVFDKGNLVQRGNHDTLLNDEHGKYANLWNAQAQYYA